MFTRTDITNVLSRLVNKKEYDRLKEFLTRGNKNVLFLVTSVYVSYQKEFS